MERKVVFSPGEFYHVFSRGVEKRKIFQNVTDYERFLALLYIFNQTQSFNMADFLKRKGLGDIFFEQRRGELVTLLSYSLMPNHFHLMIRENENGGISKFMAKLLTGYSMYFNIKYERSGPLFVKPFRSVHVEHDTHFKHLFSYIHLNCVELAEPKWKENGISDYNATEQFLVSYPYASYSEFLGGRGRGIVDQKVLSEVILRTPLKIRDYEKWYREYEKY